MTVYVVEWSSAGFNVILGVAGSIESAQRRLEAKAPSPLRWERHKDWLVSQVQSGEQYTISPWEVE